MWVLVNTESKKFSDGFSLESFMNSKSLVNHFDRNHWYFEKIAHTQKNYFGMPLKVLP